jgi:hypothetical protein
MTMDESPNRRSVLRIGAGGAIAAGCLAGMSLRSLRSAAAAAGKPPLTAANVNKLVASSRDPAALLAEAGRGLKAFLEAHFFLTPEQAKAIGTITPEDLRQVEQALGRKAETARKKQQELQDLVKEAEDSNFFQKVIGKTATRSLDARLGLTVQGGPAGLKIVAQEIGGQL